MNKQTKTWILVGAITFTICFVCGLGTLVASMLGADIQERAEVTSSTRRETKESKPETTTASQPAIACIDVTSGEPLTTIQDNLELYYSLGKYAVAVQVPEDKRTFGFPVYIVAVSYSKDIPAQDGIEIKEGKEIASYGTRVINDTVLNQVAPIDDQATWELTPGLYMLTPEGDKSNGQEIAESFWKSKWEKRAKECLKAKY
jgi:hypothetical protein